MKWIVRILAIFLLIIIIAAAIGFALPAHTEHTRTVTLKQSPDAIFAVLADVPSMPKWNTHMEKVEMLPPIDGKEATKQTFQGGMTMTIVTAESLAPAHLVREMRDDGGPFLGSWTYEIAPAESGSTVVLKEKSEVKNPFFRLMMLIFGPTKYMDDHLVDLARNFGETVTVR
jgi:Polyketide cyclase / dehydrase and lipid transport